MKTPKTLVQICKDLGGLNEIELPRTKESDYLAFMKDWNSIEARLAADEINAEEAQRRQNELLKVYEGKVFLTDQYLFDTEIQLYEFLVTKAKLNPDTARGAVKHEREHFEAAIKMPHILLKYGCFLLRHNDYDQVSCQPFVYVEATYSQFKDIIPNSINAAPEKSSHDKEQERIWKL